jgi:hypothetical protein
MENCTLLVSKRGGRTKQVTCAVSNVAAEKEEGENKIVSVKLTFGDQEPTIHRKTGAVLLEW